MVCQGLLYLWEGNHKDGKEEPVPPLSTPFTTFISACTEYASTEESETGAEHGMGSTQHSSQIRRLAERPIQ